jgi:uncharacterized protein YyaL (SSP411 family)
MDVLPVNPDKPLYTMNMLDDLWAEWVGRIDFVNGGREGAPKFMMPNNWEFLLRYYSLSKNEQVLEAIETTLQKMAYGGLYDQAGGGFARYSTDAVWKVPHFEKMLYDNGQLVSLYAHAYQLTGKPLYKDIVQETLEFVERELLDESHGFYSSLDADSEGEEGKFYVWTADELRSIWGPDYDLLAAYYHVTPAGNWEHGNNILLRDEEDEFFMKKFNLTQDALHEKIKFGKAAVMKVREQRVRPGLDDKILTSWNALMLNGYVDAYRALNDPHYLDMAVENAHFILDKCQRKDGGLNRNFKNGTSNINGFLDDYSLTIEALINLYQVTFNEDWLQAANELAEYAILHFHDASVVMFHYTSDEDPALISRTKELSDNVISSSNSSMARALFYLGQYYYKDAYIEMSVAMLNNVADQVLQNGPFYANWAILMTHLVKPPYEVAIVGENLQSVRTEFDRYYLPNILLLGSEKEGGLKLLENKYVKGRTMIYVCQDKACKLPVSEVTEALKLMD